MSKTLTTIQLPSLPPWYCHDAQFAYYYSQKHNTEFLIITMLSDYLYIHNMSDKDYSNVQKIPYPSNFTPFSHRTTIDPHNRKLFIFSIYKKSFAIFDLNTSKWITHQPNKPNHSQKSKLYKIFSQIPAIHSTLFFLLFFIVKLIDLWIKLFIDSTKVILLYHNYKIYNLRRVDYPTVQMVYYNNKIYIYFRVKKCKSICYEMVININNNLQLLMAHDQIQHETSPVLSGFRGTPPIFHNKINNKLYAVCHSKVGYDIWEKNNYNNKWKLLDMPIANMNYMKKNSFYLCGVGRFMVIIHRHPLMKENICFFDIDNRKCYKSEWKLKLRSITKPIVTGHHCVEFIARNRQHFKIYLDEAIPIKLMDKYKQYCYKLIAGYYRNIDWNNYRR
eukprot:78349_1